MGEGDLKELRELVEFLRANGIAEFDMERPELKVRLKFEANVGAAPGVSSVDLASLARLMGPAAVLPAQPVAVAGESMAAAVPPIAPVTPSTAAETPDDEAGLHIVRSPLVGTFYASPSPDAEVFVKVGDSVSMGSVLCIVEAMKIMNEIESDATGEIVKVYAKPGQPVEYGQRLFGIKQ